MLSPLSYYLFLFFCFYWVFSMVYVQEHEPVLSLILRIEPYAHLLNPIQVRELSNLVHKYFKEKRRVIRNTLPELLTNALSELANKYIDRILAILPREIRVKLDVV